MAKKKKTTKAKAAKKSKPAKKKKAAKPAAKKTKKAVKKKTVKTKKVTAKKKVIVKKKSTKKSSKKAVKKKSVAKPVKKAVKKVAKKAIAKKVRPVVKKHIEKKVVAKPAVVQQEAGHNQHQESFTPHITHLKAGDNAPDFSGIDQNGHNISLSDFDGKTLVLYFYPKDDTDGCTAESCSLRDEYQYITMQNHAVVGVSADDVDSHKKFADKYSLPFPLIADTQMNMIKAYDVWGRKRLFDHIYDGIVRTTFIIRDRKIVRVITSVNTKEHGKQVMEA